MPKNDDDYWFPAKRFGWGWGPPSRWQGWVVLVAWMLLLAAGAAKLLPHHMTAFLVFVLAMSILMIGICWFKGEPPKWRWGD